MSRTATLLEKLVAALEQQTTTLERIADHLAPRPGDIVGTPYVAQKLGCTTAWITDLIKQGEIPAGCIVEGTGNGKIWKFHRLRIDEWIKGR
jgi:predicted DNA-binding transcriptional regulator AlpA